MSKTSRDSKRGRTRRNPPVDSKTLDEVFNALAHPARRQILVVLYVRGGEMTAGEINDRFRHSWPTTTRHLGVLKEAGLVKVDGRGRNRFYSLERRDLEATTDWLSAWASRGAAGPKGRAEWADLSYATMRNAIPPEEPS